MSKYKIEYINKNIYSALVVVLTYENVFKELNEIENEFVKNNISGTIVFDNLLKAGNSEERFISGFFDGCEFDKNSFKFINIKRTNTIRQLSCSLLRKYETNIEMSILNEFQKKLLTNGLSI